jgi:hypothetical protein
MAQTLGIQISKPDGPYYSTRPYSSILCCHQFTQTHTRSDPHHNMDRQSSASTDPRYWPRDATGAILLDGKTIAKQEKGNRTVAHFKGSKRHYLISPRTARHSTPWLKGEPLWSEPRHTSSRLPPSKTPSSIPEAPGSEQDEGDMGPEPGPPIPEARLDDEQDQEAQGIEVVTPREGDAQEVDLEDKGSVHTKAANQSSSRAASIRRDSCAPSIHGSVTGAPPVLDSRRGSASAGTAKAHSDFQPTSQGSGVDPPAFPPPPPTADSQGAASILETAAAAITKGDRRQSCQAK